MIPQCILVKCQWHFNQHCCQLHVSAFIHTRCWCCLNDDSPPWPSVLLHQSAVAISRQFSYKINWKQWFWMLIKYSAIDSKYNGWAEPNAYVWHCRMPTVGKPQLPFMSNLFWRNEFGLKCASPLFRHTITEAFCHHFKWIKCQVLKPVDQVWLLAASSAHRSPKVIKYVARFMQWERKQTWEKQTWKYLQILWLHLIVPWRISNY